MGKKLDRLRSSMTFNMVGAIIVVLVFFGVIVSVLGFVSFTNAFKREYSNSTYHMAATAATLVKGDDLDDYLAGEKESDYLRTKNYLDAYCKTMAVSIIYVIDVDTSDYKSFVSIFNCVNNSVGDTKYKPWALGYRRETSSEEYEDKYEALYNEEVPYETIYRTKPTDGENPHITTLVPVKDSGGKVVAILCIQRPARELNNARMPYLFTVAVWTFLLCVAFAFFAGAYIRKEFIIPIRKIAHEAGRFAGSNKKGDDLADVSRIGEISHLGDAINRMETEMIGYIDNLTKVTADNERIETELTLASSIQNNSVPNDFPAFPDRDEFDIYGSMTPAKEVGGDFYNFFLIDDDHLALVIGDVSGKGVPAALFMMVTNILISDRTRMGGTPSSILSYVNEDICAHNKAEMFVTVWLGIFEISTGKLVAANAGHEDAAICKKDGSFELFTTKHCFVAGGMPGIKYFDFEMTLGHGDTLFLYTDGVPEATDANNVLFGNDRMLAALDKGRGGTCEDIISVVREDVDGFVKEAPQFDDLTMLCLKRK